MKNLILLIGFVAIIVATGCVSNPESNLDSYCYSGSAVKVPGFDWIGEDIFIKCDCSGQVQREVAGPDCYDCDHYMCAGKTSYTCYKLQVSTDELPYMMSPGDEGTTPYEEFVLSHSEEIACPPNHYTNVPCTDDAQCAIVGCPSGSNPECGKWGCYCEYSSGTMQCDGLCTNKENNNPQDPCYEEDCVTS